MQGVKEIEVRPFSSREEYELMLDYFYKADDSFLRGMGVERFNLQKLVCEPCAENPAPNRVLEKLGFAFVRRYRTIPGVIAYQQDVNRYELRRPNQSLEPTPKVFASRSAE